MKALASGAGPMEDVVFAAIEDEGGPLIYHNPSEDEQRSFDSTCRRLSRFLSEAWLLQK